LQFIINVSNFSIDEFAIISFLELPKAIFLDTVEHLYNAERDEGKVGVNVTVLMIKWGDFDISQEIAEKFNG